MIPSVAGTMYDRFIRLSFRSSLTTWTISTIGTIIHLPRTEHEPLFQRMFSWLRPGGRLLAVLGRQDWHGKEQNWLVEGVEMLWSHYGTDVNLEMATDAGFNVIESEIVPDPMGGGHLYLLAEKPA